jgi:hypothetical protein
MKENIFTSPAGGADHRYLHSDLHHDLSGGDRVLDADARRASVLLYFLRHGCHVQEVSFRRQVASFPLSPPGLRSPAGFWRSPISATLSLPFPGSVSHFSKLHGAGAGREDLAHGDIETEQPGYLGAQDTYYVGTISSIGRVRGR